MRRAVVGLAAAVVATGAATALWGRAAWPGAPIFAGVAVALQLIAARAMRRSGRPATLDHLTVYVGGVFLRLLGVAMLGVAVAVDRTTFHPWASSIGYLGTVLPLLYLETRLGA
ncbi:MAG TPA: hypothetical protein VGM77_01430 [Gemmatimonadales bacterium]